MASSDQYVYDLSTETDSNPHVFMRKEWATVLDQSTGSYSSNVSRIETSSLSNASKWVNWYESRLIIPLSIYLTGAPNGTFNPTAQPCDFAVGMKNTFLTLIHAIQIKYNATDITNSTGYSSMWNCFKLQTSFNATDYASFATICFAPDTLPSVNYTATPTAAGCGVVNNSNYGVPESVVGTSNKAGQVNIGFLQRQNFLNYNPSLQVNNGVSSYSAVAQATTLYKSFCTSIAPTGTTSGIWALFGAVEVRLRDVHDFFASAPLIRGGYLNLNILLNNTSFGFNTIQGQAVGADAGTQPATAASMFLTSVTSSQGGVNPLMIASGVLGSGNAIVNGGSSLFYPQVPPTATGLSQPTLPYIASIQVGSTCLNTTQLQNMGNQAPQNPFMKSVTLSIPQYTFSPDIELAFVGRKTQKISFNDIFQYTVINVAANGGTINNLITNGIQGAQGMLVVPTVASATNFLGTGGTLALPQFQSPFDPCGGGPSAYCANLTNVQVLVAGSNLLQKNAQYMYESFGQLYQGQAGQINGNLSDGLSSGLIDQNGFFYSPFYYFDLNRNLASDDLVLKSITLLGTNTGSLPLDLYIFISFKREFTIDLMTGAII